MIRAVGEVSPEQMKAVIDAVKTKLMGYGVKYAKKDAEELCVRALMPATDLGLNTEAWDNESTLTANTWSEDWSHELSEDECVVFIGVANRTDNPQVVGTKFKVGSSGNTTRDVQMYEELYVMDEPRGLFKEPIVYVGKETIYIEHYSKTTITAGQELLELIGYIVKPYGNEISAKLPYPA